MERGRGRGLPGGRVASSAVSHVDSVAPPCPPEDVLKKALHWLWDFSPRLLKTVKVIKTQGKFEIGPQTRGDWGGTTQATQYPGWDLGPEKGHQGKMS